MTHIGRDGLIWQAEREKFTGPHDDRMSKQHAIILCNEGSLSIIDNQSCNGVFVDGVQTHWHSTSLNDGDALTLGETNLRVVSNAGVRTQSYCASRFGSTRRRSRGRHEQPPQLGVLSDQPAHLRSTRSAQIMQVA